MEPDNTIYDMAEFVHEIEKSAKKISNISDDHSYTQKEMEILEDLRRAGGILIREVEDLISFVEASKNDTF